MASVVGGERLAKEDLPRADLAPRSKQQFVVRDELTYLVCGQASDGTVQFPAGEQHASTIEVGPQGLLYSYATIHVSATRKTPYTIGYVDFPGGLRVLASVRGQEDTLQCDLQVRLAHDENDWFVEPVPKEARQ